MTATVCVWTVLIVWHTIDRNLRRQTEIRDQRVIECVYRMYERTLAGKASLQDPLLSRLFIDDEGTKRRGSSAEIPSTPTQGGNAARGQEVNGLENTNKKFYIKGCQPYSQ